MLTPTEQRVFDLLVGRCFTNKEMARDLGISVRTVKFHMSNILEKLRCESRAEVIFKFRP